MGMGLKRASYYGYILIGGSGRAESIRVPSVSAEADLKFSYYNPHSTRTVWTTCKVVSFPFPRFRELSDPSCTARGLEHLPPSPPPKHAPSLLYADSLQRPNLSLLRPQTPPFSPSSTPHHTIVIPDL